MKLNELTVQEYRNMVSGPTPTDTSVGEYIRLITEGHEVQQVLDARAHGKGQPAYKEAKEQRKAFTFNFLFAGKKRDSRITAATGLLYFDIDAPEYDIATLDLGKVFIKHHSFGGKGWAVFVRVDGLTPDNFAATVDDIGEQLGIKAFFDQNARRKTQYVVCSYDPALYYNPEAHVFQAVGKQDYTGWYKPAAVNQQHAGYVPLRMTNAEDFVPENALYETFEDGIMTAKVILQANVTAGRNNYLYTVCSQVTALNPDRPEGQIANFMQEVAVLAGFDQAYSKATLPKVLKSVFGRKSRGELTYHNNKRRKVIFSKHCKWNGEMKQAFALKLNAVMRRDKTRDRLYKCIEEWDQDVKITAKTISKESGCDASTVYRYYAELKEYVQTRNEEMGLLRSKARKPKDPATHENKQRPTPELATETAPRHAQPPRSAQDSARTSPGAGVGVDSEPQAATRAAQAAEGQEDEPLAVRAGGRRQPDERASEDFPCPLELQATLAQEYHEDEDALWPLRGADGGRGVGPGPELPGEPSEEWQALEIDDHAADGGHQLPDSAGPGRPKPAGFDSKDVEEYSEEDFAYRHYLNRQLAYA